MLQLRLSSESTNDWIFGKKYVIDLGFSGFYKAKEKCFSGGFVPWPSARVMPWDGYWVDWATKHPPNFDIPKTCSKAFDLQISSWIVFQKLFWALRMSSKIFITTY